MNEGIFTASASKQRKIFSQVTKAKKEIFKNASDTKPAVKEEKQMPSFQQLRSSLEEKTLTPAEKTKREEIAKAMERETPGMPMAKKMAIATAQAKKVTEAKDSREYDYEGDMSKSQLRSIIANAQTVHDMLEDNTNMAEWVQSKITLAADYISTVADYMQSEVNEAVTVKKNNYSWGKMMTVHHGASTSYPLHPEHQQAIAKLGDGERTSFKDETNTHVVARRDGDNVHLTQPKKSSTMTTVSHSHFTEGYVPDHSGKLNPSDTKQMGRLAALMAKEKTATPRKPAGEYDRKVTSYLKKKYNEETVVETKGAPKGFHFTKDGKLKRGDANQDGDGGPMLRSDPLDKQRSKVPAVSEAENPCWDGYKMLGMKDKGGKKVPNCIPEESHYCAKHVYSNMFGEGTVVEGIHADPDEQGNVEWYAVQFNEGIKKVFTEKLEIMMAEFHGNHKKKKRMTNG